MSTAAPALKRPDGSNVRVLVVDDESQNRYLLEVLLGGEGFEVESASNGRQALAAARLRTPDLVISDILMPEMDGYEATALIRQDPRWKKLPIIAVTAKAMKDDQERCLAAGSNDYLAKPIDLDRLFSLIRVWLPQLERI